MVDLVVINFQAYFLNISIRFFINCSCSCSFYHSNFYFRLCEIEKKNNYVHYDVVMCFCCCCFLVRPLVKVTVNHIQSFSINSPHTVMCTFVLLKWIYGIHISAFHPNCCHSLHQVILTEQCYIHNITKYLVCEHWHEDIRHARG